MDKLVKRFVALSISSRLTQGEEQADAGRESNGTGESPEHQRIPARGQSTHDRDPSGAGSSRDGKRFRKRATSHLVHKGGFIIRTGLRGESFFAELLSQPRCRHHRPSDRQTAAAGL